MTLNKAEIEIAKTALYEHLSKFITLDDHDKDLLGELLPVRRYVKGSFLLRAGEVSREFFFNVSGFVRLFYLQQGEQRTAYFYQENLFISAYASFVKQIPANFSLQATEDTTVVVINLEAAQKLLAASSKFEALARMAMEEELISHQEIIANLLTLTPEERFLHLQQNNPGIFQRVPQIHIASYLGVKPESLSRIKKRAQQKS